MFSMAVLSLVFLFSLVSSVRGQVVAGTKQDFFECGRFQCINETGVTCHNDKWCRCPPGQIGDARIECVEPNNNCLCTLGGDPHMVTFAGQSFTLPLPCAQILSQFTVKTTAFPQGCGVSIHGTAVYNGTAPHPYAAFETQLDVVVVTETTNYAARIVRNQKPITEANGLEVKEFIGDGFFSAEVPDCSVWIKYKDDKSFFSLLTSSRNVDYREPGLCGKCGNNRPNPPLALDPMQALEKQLLTYSDSSPIDNGDLNTFPACSDLKGQYQSCPDDRKEFVLKFCGSLLLEETRDCFFGLSGDVMHLLDTFLTCLEYVCLKVPCTAYPPMFESCTFDGMQSYLTNPAFCSNGPTSDK